MLPKSLRYCTSKSLIFVLPMFTLTLPLCLVSTGHGRDPWRGGEQGDVETPKPWERGNGDAAESPEGVPANLGLWLFPEGRCSGFSALLQASAFVAGHLFTSVLTFIGLENSWQASREEGEEILLCPG